MPNTILCKLLEMADAELPNDCITLPNQSWSCRESLINLKHIPIYSASVS